MCRVADPFGTDPDPRVSASVDPDPYIYLFVIDLQDSQQFFCLLLFEGTFTSFFKDKSHKEVTKQWELRFFLLF